ncbi:unnamed protein product [Schistocephalus solidus]|uniref:Uncharacterized protein n=1 Tax=Schistocephalus solidus TaxID=70667 RepID=A0A183SN88_SCHSO|nr:unnamed protein product [Schistocephalus solidus]
MGGILIIVAMLAVSTHALRITSASVRYQIPENSPVGTMLGFVTENRLWNGVNYQFGAPSQLFQVDPITSELLSIAELDAEKLCALANHKESDASQNAYHCYTVLSFRRSRLQAELSVPLLPHSLPHHLGSQPFAPVVPSIPAAAVAAAAAATTAVLIAGEIELPINFSAKGCGDGVHFQIKRIALICI